MRPLAYALAVLALAALVCLPTRPPEIVTAPTDPVVWVTVTPTTTVTVTPTVWVTK